MSVKISVSMIVKNESSCIAKALNSVADADEIVVCDTGSTDDTVEIAQNYGAKVFTDYQWNDSSQYCRRKSWPQAHPLRVLQQDPQAQ